MKKWYQSIGCKWILIALAHVTAIYTVIAMLSLVVYQSISVDDLLELGVRKQYEETESFEQEMLRLTRGVKMEIEAAMALEIEGVYNPDWVVDIMNGELLKKVPEDGDSIYYRVGDLITWTGEDAKSIVVCQKEDGSYHYYSYSDFESLILSEEAQLDTRNLYMYNDEATSSEIITEFLNALKHNYESEYKYDNCSVLDSEGKILYEDIWSFGDYISEEYSPVGEKSLMDIVNNNSQWNGQLKDIINTLCDAIFTNQEYYDTYTNGSDSLKEGNSNFLYLYVDEAAKKVYTNRGEYSNYEKYEQSLENMQEIGEYVIVENRLADSATSIAAVDMGQWQDTVLNEIGSNDIYAAAVDTSYPIQDSFYKNLEAYKSYNPRMTIGAIVLFFIVLVWLTAVAGRSNAQEGVVLAAFDKVPTEIACGLVAAAWWFITWLLYGIFGSLPQSAEVLVSAVWGFGSIALFLIGYLSLIRRMKARTLWKSSLFRWLLGWIKKLGQVCLLIFHERSCTFKIIILAGVFVIFHWIAMIFYGNRFFIFSALALEVAALGYLIYEAIAKQRIRRGLKRISEGEIDYKISKDRLIGDNKEIAQMINHIGEGLDAAVEKSMRDERLKTDLITNVSHDIKTPLTSIINYVDLLKRENFTDPKILGYLDVLDAKSQRLKALTEDVVEASKVSSGNVNLEFMNVDLVEMLHQTNGEFAERFAQKNMEMIMNIPEEQILVRVDGRRMWRVLENIFNNAAKYAMDGTRIYGDMRIDNGEVEFALKNISANALNISPDELTERFIRGDDSRTTEGSGLGLSIAKSLTKLQGGKFKIIIDGDLFKVIIRFPRVLGKD